jgi:hypothetical protein
MASTYLTRTPSAGNRKTFTWSAWVKRSAISYQNLTGCFHSSSNYCNFQFASDGLRVYDNGNVNVATNAKAMDVNGWYHFVFRIDTTQSTASNRVRIYINGVQQTSFASSTYPSQNFDFYYNANNLHGIGARSDGDSKFDGSMSHIHFCDGYSYDASSFGSTDATTGEWKINTDPSVSYGTNGYWILKDGNTVTDSSPNSNNWTVNGTLTKTEDCPSNVFATMNPLSAGSDVSFANGNTYVENTVSTWNSSLGTIGVGNGKYYWEAMRISSAGECNLGVTLSSAYGGNHSQVDAGRIVYSNNGYVYREGLSGQGNTNTGTSFTGGDIIGVAIDTENGTLKFYKNGTLVNTTTDNSFLYTNNEYIPQCGLYGGGRLRFNFGNGYFADNAVSSAGTNASNNGIFEYDVPTGYTALSTRGLNL